MRQRHANGAGAGHARAGSARLHWSVLGATRDARQLHWSVLGATRDARQSVATEGATFSVRTFGGYKF